MIEKHKKLIRARICFFVFLLSGFFYLSIKKVIAATGLEVDYPTISGQSLTTSSSLPEYVKYLFNAGMLVGSFAVFISLAIAGIMFFLSPVSAQLKTNAKERVSSAISGLLILVLTYLIITTINPQLSILRGPDVPEITQSTATEKKAAGIYFYTGTGCSDKDVTAHQTSMSDLGDSLRYLVNSVGIVKDDASGTAYVSILYQNTNLWGMCKYLDPNKDCQPVTPTPFAASASIYQYDSDPTDDGVYFFRKSCFNNKDNPDTDIGTLLANCQANSGGWYEVENDDIKGIFGGPEGELKTLSFTGSKDDPECNVPEDEQDCTKYDKNGTCEKRSCPTLGGENISSIIIKGNYLVLFIYQAPDGTANGPWASCQEFPTPRDINKIGPQQIKWENIRNTGGVIPNYVIIIPIKNNSGSNASAASVDTSVAPGSVSGGDGAGSSGGTATGGGGGGGGF